MKIRTSFVSNSSAASFILDGRVERVQEILKQNRHLGKLEFGCRLSGIIVGEAAMDAVEADSYISGRGYVEAEWGQSGMLLEQLYPIAEEIGRENIVIIRESDEDMGGSLQGTDWEELGELALHEMEWH